MDAGPRGLDQWLRGRGLAPEPFLRLALPMAAALAELHERQVLHRALSPRNVLFDREGRASFTGAGAGCPAARHLPYAAPELTGRTGRPADARSDLYALGAIYFEMLTGAPPFGTPASLDLLHAHLAREPTPPRSPEPRRARGAVGAGAAPAGQDARGSLPERPGAVAGSGARAAAVAAPAGGRPGSRWAPSDLDQALPLPPGLYGRDGALGAAARGLGAGADRARSSWCC